jgi:hypothetical protein
MQNATAPIPPPLIANAKLIADKIWVLLDKKKETGESIEENIEWLGRAINDPAGQLFEFYVQSVARIQQQGNAPQSPLEEYKVVFSEALRGRSRSAQLARVVLASQAYFLFQLDRDWTTENVFPILDPALDEERARQCWHGFLYWGRWTDSMLVNLLKCYENMFLHIDKEKREIRGMFCGHLAGISVYSSIKPLENGWLFRFLTTVKSETRSLWAADIRQVIAGLENDAKLNLWKRWLSNYWNERGQGRPLPLSEAEAAEMVQWALKLDPVFPEAVALVKKGPQPKFEHSMIYYQISESPLVKQHPESMVEFLSFLTAGEGARPVYDLDKLYSTVGELIQLIPKHPQLRILCDRLASLGVSGVSELAAKLDPPYNVP